MLDFPNSPITGATYTGPGGVIWAFDGVKWVNGTQIGTAYAPIKDPVFTGNPTAPTPPAGDADTSLATTSFVAAATGTALNNVGRNLIHNPLFNIAQRGAGPWTVAGYGTDRWWVITSLDTITWGPFSISDAERTAIGDEAATTAEFHSVVGNAGAAAYTVLTQPIENVRRLAGKTVTVSFYALTGTSLKVGVSIDQNMGTGGSPSAAVPGIGQSVQLTTTWTRYSLTFTVPSLAGKTLGTNNNHATSLLFWLSSGTTNASRAGNIGVQSGAINIWGVQLEVGSVATPLEKPDPRYDLANCQRFFQTGSVQMQTYSAAGSTIIYVPSLLTQMRASPTIVVAGQSYSNASGLAIAALTPGHIQVQATVTALGQAMFFGAFTASADL
jgi:hypothetical protein